MDKHNSLHTLIKVILLPSGRANTWTEIFSASKANPFPQHHVAFLGTFPSLAIWAYWSNINVRQKWRETKFLASKEMYIVRSISDQILAIWEKEICEIGTYRVFLDSVGEGEGGMIWENSIETCILSYVKQITSPGSMHETGCSGLVHWDDPERWDR